MQRNLITFGGAIAVAALMVPASALAELITFDDLSLSEKGVVPQITLLNGVTVDFSARNLGNTEDRQFLVYDTDPDAGQNADPDLEAFDDNAQLTHYAGRFNSILVDTGLVGIIQDPHVTDKANDDARGGIITVKFSAAQFVKSIDLFDASKTDGEGKVKFRQWHRHLQSIRRRHRHVEFEWLL